MATLSQIKINARSRDVQRDLADSHGMHRRVMSLLPDRAETPSLRAHTATLHRLDRFPDGSIHLLVQSGLDDLRLDTLPAGYAVEAPRTLNLDAFHARLHPGLTVRYAIAANPTRSIVQPGGQRGKRVPLAGYDAVRRWWDRKATEAGLTLIGGPRIDPAPQPSGTRGAHRVVHRAQRIEGSATVADVAALKRALTEGIGRGKAYGLGLLTLALVRAVETEAVT